MNQQEIHNSRDGKNSFFFGGGNFKSLNNYRILLLFFLLPIISLTASTGKFHDDFKSYDDFDPATKNWTFNTIGGEVINDSFVINVPLGKTQALVRDFSAGSELEISAKVKAEPHYVDIFNKNGNGFMGIIIRADKFYRGMKQDENIPTISLLLKKYKNKHVFSLTYCGKPKLKENIEQNTILEWKEGVEYTLKLSFKNSVVSAVVQDGNETVYKAKWNNPELGKLFRKTYPGFVSYKTTGKVLSFDADNLKSVTTENNIKLIEFAPPKTWIIAQKNKEVNVRLGKTIDLGTMLGGHGKGKEINLKTVVVSDKDCYVYTACKVDWYWKLEVNGKLAADYTKRGSGIGFVTVIFPLRKGKNTIDLTVRSGAGGWKFCFKKADYESASTLFARKNVRGSGKLFWNIDRLLDDIMNLERRAIKFDSLKTKLVNLRKNLSASLDSREIVKYDKMLDQAYAAIYDGYRYLELLNAISEFSSFGIDNTKLTELKLYSVTMKKQLNTSENIESTAKKAAKIITELKKDMNGFTEGVSRGGSFGRFGWVTSANLGAYSSGDGLLANQVLSNGAIVRQYVMSIDNPKDIYRINFNFSGNTDKAKAKKLFAEKDMGKNVEIEFGYLPGMFYSSKTPDEVKVKTINWMHKKFSYKNDFMLDMSLASPAILLESPLNKFELMDSKSGAFTNIGYKNPDGQIVSANISGNGIIYDRKKDGDIGTNWIMLWCGKNSETDLAGHKGNVPLEVIFQRHPNKIERINDKVIISFSKTGALWLCTPYGTRIQPTLNWKGLLPAKAALKADLFGKMALAYPVNCHEFYRYDKSKAQVEIINKYSYRLFEDNDWNIIPLKTVLIPPILSLMMDNGFDAVMPGNLYDLEYPTLYGPLRGIRGSELTYSMPVPDIPLIKIGGNTEVDKDAVKSILKMTRHRIHGVRSYLLEERSFYSWHSLRFFTGFIKQWYYLPKTYRGYLMKFYERSIMMSSSYRDERVWRSLIEPYSGLKYFYSFSILPRGPGDTGVFGDRGYGLGLHLLAIDRIIEYSGNYDLLRKLWKDPVPLAPGDAVKDGEIITVDKMFGYLKNVHDWAYMFAGSNDCGDNGPVVDCTQATFAGHAAYMRMALKIGTEADIARGAYYLAKSQPGLLGRSVFEKYGSVNGLFGSDRINVGFRECLTPTCFTNASRLGSYYFSSYNANLHYAGGFDGFDIYFPYAKYIWNDFRKEERKRQEYFPNIDTDGHYLKEHHTSGIQFMFLDGQPLNVLRKIYHNIVGKGHYVGDLDILPMLINGGNPLVLTNWYPVAIPDFYFTPSTMTASIKFSSVPGNYTLHTMSSTKPVNIRMNGKELKSWKYNPKTFKLSVNIPSGRNIELEFKYENLDLNRVTPIPIPPAQKRLLEMEGKIDYFTFSRAKTAVHKKSLNSSKMLFRSKFDCSQGKKLRVAGGFSFKNWAGSKKKISGGLTGLKPINGKPAESLVVKVTDKGFSGRVSPRIDLPSKFKVLTVSGQFMTSSDYRGNYPMIFLWVVDKNRKGKPVFNNIKKFRKNHWESFTMNVPISKLPADTRSIQINLTSRKSNDAGSEKGCIFFKNIKASVE